MSVVVVADPDTSHGSKDTKKTTETTGRTKLANTGRITDSQTRMDEDIWIENHPALREITSTRNQTNIQSANRKAIEEAQPYETSGNPKRSKRQRRGELRSKTHKRKNTKRIQTMKIPPRVKDLMRYLIIGKIKCGTNHTGPTYTAMKKGRSAPSVKRKTMKKS